jgi:hypothetical protein
VFFALTFSEAFAAGHPNVTVTALGGASAGRRFFVGGADNVVPANISDVSSLVATGRLPIDMVLLQVSGPDERGQYNAGLGIEHLHAAHQHVDRLRFDRCITIRPRQFRIDLCDYQPRPADRQPPRRRSSCRRGPQGRSIEPSLITSLD